MKRGFRLASVLRARQAGPGIVDAPPANAGSYYGICW